MVRVVPLLLTRVLTEVLGCVERVEVPVLADVAVLVVPVVAVVELDLEEVVVLVEDEEELFVLLEEAAGVVDVLALVELVVVVGLVSSFVDALLTSDRNWPALRTDTPLVLEAVRVTRCSNEPSGCCVA